MIQFRPACVFYPAEGNLMRSAVESGGGGEQ